jgi:hypothetical protein
MGQIVADCGTVPAWWQPRAASCAGRNDGDRIGMDGAAEGASLGLTRKAIIKPAWNSHPSKIGLGGAGRCQDSSLALTSFHSARAAQNDSLVGQGIAGRCCTFPAAHSGFVILSRTRESAAADYPSACEGSRACPSSPYGLVKRGSCGTCHRDRGANPAGVKSFQSGFTRLVSAIFFCVTQTLIFFYDEWRGERFG